MVVPSSRWLSRLATYGVAAFSATHCADAVTFHRDSSATAGGFAAAGAGGTEGDAGVAVCGEAGCEPHENAATCDSDCRVVGIFAGCDASCAILRDTTARCWGYNSFGQLGSGSLEDQFLPSPMQDIRDVSSIAFGPSHTCASTQDGTVWCAGYYASLGNGSYESATVPVQVSGLASATGVAAGQSHTCATLVNGSVWCWGGSSDGQVGAGGFNFYAEVPIQVQGVSEVVAVVAGLRHTCALNASGGAQCWGLNAYGQLGDGTTFNSSVPVPVVGLNDATALAAGSIHTCALRQGGTVTCWGDNRAGQLGDSISLYSPVPVDVPGVAAVSAIAAAYGYHTCALLDDGTVTCWGNNEHGQLGNGMTADMQQPVAVLGLESAISIVAGYYHSCALAEDGVVWCWGAGASGILGNGSEADSSTPVKTGGL